MKDGYRKCTVTRVMDELRRDRKGLLRPSPSHESRNVREGDILSVGMFQR